MNESDRLTWDPTVHYKDVDVAQRYDDERFARLTGRLFNALEKAYIARAFANVPAGARILDLPCGTGRLAEVLLDRGLDVHGVDISPAMLEVARRKLARFGTRFSTQVADVRDLAGGAAETFEAGMCARVLMHFPLAQQIEFLAGVAALVRGPLVITHSLSTPYHRFRRDAKRWIGNPPSAGYPITNAELERLLAGARLRELRRLRPSRLITEEIIVVAEPVG